MYTGDEREVPSETVQSEFLFDREDPVYGKPGSDESNEDYNESDDEIVTDGGREAGTLAAVSHTLDGEVSVQGTMERGPETEEGYETISDGGFSGMPVAGFVNPPSYNEEGEEVSSMGEFPM